MSAKHEGHGCALIIALAAIATGIGYLFGAGFGWLTFGVALLIMAVI